MFWVLAPSYYRSMSTKIGTAEISAINNLNFDVGLRTDVSNNMIPTSDRM